MSRGDIACVVAIARLLRGTKHGAKGSTNTAIVLRACPYETSARRRAYPLCLARRPITVKWGQIEPSYRCHKYLTQPLARRWSPQQVCRALKDQFPDEPRRQLAHETIYRALYRSTIHPVPIGPAALLRSGRSRRRPRALTRAKAQFPAVDNRN